MRDSTSSSVIRRQRKVNQNRLFDLALSIFVLYFLYFITGLLYESVINNKYHNIFTKKPEKCKDPDAINFALFLVAWMFGEIQTKQAKVKIVYIPDKNSALTGFAYAFGQCCSILAIRRLGYPLVTMAESSSVIVVIIIAIFFTRVQDQRLSLQPKKLLIGIVVTAGILIFYFSAPAAKQATTKKDWISGLFFIALVLLTQGMVPDLQAQIKSKYKPSPIQMMTIINKWSTIFMFLYLTFTLKFWDFVYFIVAHPIFAAHLFGNCILAAIGQIFVYKVIQQFKQHILPFVRASRKVLTVVISIFFYGHSTNLYQIFGIILVLGTIIFQFFLAITDETVTFADGTTSDSGDLSRRQSFEELEKLERQRND